MERDDDSYYDMREAQERDRAENSPDPAIARVHKALADRYAAKNRAKPKVAKSI